MILAACMACCLVDGIPAVCQSAEVERLARIEIMRLCPPCDPVKVGEWIATFQGPRGPQENPQMLANEVLTAMRQQGQTKGR